MTNNNDNIPVFNAISSAQSADYPFPSRYTNIQEGASYSGIKEFTGYDTQEEIDVTLFFCEKPLLKSAKNQIEKTFENITSLQHANIKAIADYEITDSIYWTEEISSGISLTDSSYKTLNSATAFSLINQIIDTFSYIHQYQILGKLSLEDVFINNNKDISLSFKSIILDQLGLAKTIIRPPEQKASQSFQSKYADIYIVGVIIENILSKSVYANKLAVAKVVNKAKHDEPSKRFHELTTFKTELNKQLKHNAAHFWLSGSRAVIITITCTCFLIFILFSDLIVTSVTNVLPKSEDERLIIQQTSQISIEKLQSKLASYNKQIQKLKVDQNRLIKSRSQADQKRKYIIENILTELENTLSEKDSLQIVAEIHAIETLHKEKHYEKVIAQSSNYTKRIDEAYDLAYFGIEVYQGNQQISELESQYPLIAKQQYVLDEYTSITRKIESKQIAGLYNESIVPLIDYYHQQAQVYASNKISTIIRDIEKNMVSIPSGSYFMGIKKAGFVDTKPVHEVEVSQFHVSKYEVTVGIYNQYLSISNKSFSTGHADDPVTNISWVDAMSFVDWLANKSGKGYRLLTESEWEYLAKANIKSTYPWGNSLKKEQAQCADCLKVKPKSYSRVGSFKENQFGLYDINGNVWEWTQDCYKRNYIGAPQNGKAYISDNCQRKVIRGGAWNSKKNEMYPSYRTAAKPDFTSSTIGFRIGRD
jgi:formylglycine-generating enzyme required for sulfatase activity